MANHRKRGGRPRKLDAARRPNGRIRRAAKPAVTPELMARRLALVNGDQAAAMTEIPGRGAALLVFWGVLSPRQGEALERYRREMLRFRVVMGLPRRGPSPGAPVFVSEPGADDADAAVFCKEEADEKTIHRVKDRARALVGLLGGASSLRRWIADEVALDDQAPERWRDGADNALIDVLRKGADDLADWFGLPDEAARRVG